MSDALETALEAALRDLAADLRVPPPHEGLTARVMERVQPLPVPRSPSAISTWLRGRARWLVALVAGLLAVGIAVSPVGATVADWFGFHGVLVTRGGHSLTGEPSVPAAGGRVTLDQARALVGFEPAVPGALGNPDQVSVSSDHRIASMSWGSGDGTVRLDQFEGSIDPVFWKRTPLTQLTLVGSTEGLWFPTPHEVVVLFAGNPGQTRSLSPRMAAPTLVWQGRQITFRLEGRLSRDRAVEVAESIE